MAWNRFPVYSNGVITDWLPMTDFGKLDVWTNRHPVDSFTVERGYTFENGQRTGFYAQLLNPKGYVMARFDSDNEPRINSHYTFKLIAQAEKLVTNDVELALRELA